MTGWPFGFWDITLMLAVSVHATVMAYVRDPRWKAVVYGIPIPFTLATLALGRPVGITHALGIPMILFYIHGVRWLYVRAHLPIVLSIAACALGYCVIGTAVAGVVQDTEGGFWLVLFLIYLTGAALYFGVPHREQPGHRSPLSVPLKFLIICAVITGLLLLKHRLQGFVTSFPMVGVVGAYEARYSLWNLGRQASIMLLAAVPLLGLCHFFQAAWGLPGGLAMGWLGFLCVLIPLTQRMWCRAGPAA